MDNFWFRLPQSFLGLWYSIPRLGPTFHNRLPASHWLLEWSILAVSPMAFDVLSSILDSLENQSQDEQKIIPVSASTHTAPEGMKKKGLSWEEGEEKTE